MTHVQTLYWESQKLHDQLAAMEHTMRKITNQGKTCRRIQEKYIGLLDELRDINSQMLFAEENQSRLLQSCDALLVMCV